MGKRFLNAAMFYLTEKLNFGYFHIISYTTISCPRCEYETPLVFALKCHIKANHLWLEYECEICEHNGDAKESLKTHKNDEH